MVWLGGIKIILGELVKFKTLIMKLFKNLFNNKQREIQIKLKVGDRFKENKNLVAEVIKVENNWVTYKMIDDISLKFFNNNSFKNEFQFSEGSEHGKNAIKNII